MGTHGRNNGTRATDLADRHGHLRRQPPDWTGYTGRINTAMLAEVGWAADANPIAYICGPTSFVETAAAALVGLGYPQQRVKTERFGATGGK